MGFSCPAVVRTNVTCGQCGQRSGQCGQLIGQCGQLNGQWGQFDVSVLLWKDYSKCTLLNQSCYITYLIVKLLFRNRPILKSSYNMCYIYWYN